MAAYWLEQGEANVPPENEWLSAAEWEHWQSLRFPKRRNDWRLGRWTAKRAVAAWLRLPASPLVFAQVEVVAAPDGAPEVFIADRAAALSLSLSHRGGTAFCVLAPAGTALGCDLEIIEPRSDAFLADYFTAEEQAYVAGAEAGERERLLAVLWSAKESALKALRVGLRSDTRDVTVALAPGWPDLSGWGALEVHARDAGVFQGWWQTSGDFVRTIVGDSITAPPQALSLRIPVAASACA